MTGGVHWLGGDALAEFQLVGYVIIAEVFDKAFLETTRAALQRSQGRVLRDIGEERLSRAGEVGVIRNMMVHEQHFYSFLEHPVMLEIVDRTVGGTAILHLQNGLVLPSVAQATTPDLFQYSFHRDFPRYLNGYTASINVMVAIDSFEKDNGALTVVPASHQQATAPSTEYMSSHAIPVIMPAGSVVVFDSTLWHAAGLNTSGRDRMAVNHQFTRSWIKQQIDYVRAIGVDQIEQLSPRTQQLLGMYSRVVTSLDEFYQPEDRRLYRRGQG